MLGGRTGSDFLHHFLGNSAAFHLVWWHFEERGKPSHLVGRRNPLSKFCFAQVGLVHLYGGCDLAKCQVLFLAKFPQPSAQPHRLALVI